MDDLIEEAGPAGNAPEFTVSELSGAVKRTIEGGFARVRVRGEVGRVSRPRSGHLYLDLKDDRAVLAGVVWKGQAARLATQPEEGMEVIATGRLTTFPGQSKYQIVIDTIAPAGVGALMAMLEKRRAALAAEGLFDAARKRPLPYLPAVIGVVTSPSGAVIRDILHRLADRFPRQVLVWPVAVQGERCAAEVARAIAGFNALQPGGPVPRPDLLIVARGGGSLEDLWGFNDEAVVRAAAASTIPLISAVGHETDTTLIDHAADRRAPTPTAAAEMAVPVRADLLAWAEAHGARLTGAVARDLAGRGQRLRDVGRALPRAEDLTRGSEQRLDLWGDRLPRSLRAHVAARHLALSRLSGGLRPGTLAGALRSHGRDLGALVQRIALARRSGAARRLASVDAAGDRLTLRGIRRRLGEARENLPGAARRMEAAMATGLARRHDRLAAAHRLSRGLSYHATLARGYAVVRAAGHVVTDRAAAVGHAALELEFADGRLDVASAGAVPDPAPRRAAPGKPKAEPRAAQPGLFDD